MVAPLLFAGQAGSLRHIEFTGLGRPLHAEALQPTPPNVLIELYSLGQNFRR